MTGFYRLPVTGSRVSGSASWQGRFWGSWRGVLVLLPGKEGSGAPGEEFWFCFLAWEGSGLPGVGVLVLVRLACVKEVNPTQGSNGNLVLLLA